MSLSYRRVLLAWVSPIACIASAPSVGMAAEAAVHVEIPAGPLDVALLTLGRQAKLKIMFTSELVAGRRTAGVSGQMPPSQALAHLLAGAKIDVRQAGPGVLVLYPQGQGVLRPTATDGSTRGGDGGASALTGDPLTTASLAQTDVAPAPLSPSTEPFTVSEIVVGSHIRGAHGGASPVVVLGREDIDRGGYATVADALTDLPQAFGGTTSDDTIMTGADTTGTNQARATAVNLRGLGADATLVLVNGRRLAGAGLLGDFADLSSIPLAAVARVEVLLDGASALYGSDAVGGVVNVVLRDRYNDAETRARIGGSTHGDMAQRQLAQTFGKSWNTGSLLLSAEYQTRGRSRSADRDYTASADLRPLGGTDRRLYYSMPATILGIDPITFSLVPMWAVPAGQDGTRLKPADFIAGGQNLTNWRAAVDNLPKQERGGFYAAVTQEVGARVTLNADARYSDRRYTAYSVAPLTVMVVDARNPYFVSPNGASSNYVGYSFQNETGGLKNTGEVQSRALSMGAKVRLPADWRLDLYAGHGEEIATSLSTHGLNSAFLNEALGATADNPLTAYNPTRDGYFNPYIGQGRNNQAVLDFIISGYDTRRTVGRLDTVSATADGPLFALPAGAVRLAVGAQWREEGLKTIGVSGSVAATPRPAFSRLAERRVSSLFAELRAPLFGETMRHPGLERLELSAAVRRETYTGGLSSTVPKVGVVWGPTADINLKATYGESFRAPSLSQQSDPETASPTNVSFGAGTALTLIRYGGNRDLKPEQAKSWTAGIEWVPAAWPGTRLSATLFDARFTNRIARPANDNISTVLTAPDLAPFRIFVTPGTNAADLALVQALLKNATSASAGLYPATSYRAIADARYVNAGSFHVRGLDLTGTYGLTVKSDPVVIGGNLSWLMSYARRITAAAQSVELAGMATYPADLRARFYTSWTHGAFTTTASASHVGDLREVNATRIDSQTTFDLQVQWTSPAKVGVYRNLGLALTVQNLFDKDPPFYDSRVGVGYDPANYDPTGRVIALQLTKAW
jgi:outer membrane receptor protein involved in Fe transport